MGEQGTARGITFTPNTTQARDAIECMATLSNNALPTVAAGGSKWQHGGHVRGGPGHPPPPRAPDPLAYADGEE